MRVLLMLDLSIAHDRFGSSSGPSLNGRLHYPNTLDGPLNETVTDKIRQYLTDYNNKLPSNDISFMNVIICTSGIYIMNLCIFYFYRLIGKLTTFTNPTTLDYFEYRRHTYNVQITHSPVTLSNLSSINLVSSI